MEQESCERDQDQRYYGIEKGYRVVERRGTFVDSDI